MAIATKVPDRLAAAIPRHVEERHADCTKTGVLAEQRSLPTLDYLDAYRVEKRLVMFGLPAGTGSVDEQRLLGFAIGPTVVGFLSEQWPGDPIAIGRALSVMGAAALPAAAICFTLSLMGARRLRATARLEDGSV